MTSTLRASQPAPLHPSEDTGRVVLQQLRKIGPLGFIILLHVGFFYALQSGLINKVSQVIPKEVIVSFITPEAPKPETPTPEQPKPRPAPPKPLVQPKVVKPVAKPVTPVVNSTPSPQAITTPPAPPAPAEPAAVAAPPTPPAPPAPPAQPKTVTSGVEYLQPPQPEYPPQSKRLGEEGVVMLRILVNERGRPEQVTVHKSSGAARLDEAARQAVLRAVFKPYTENGKPIPVFAILPIRFQLDS